MPPISSQGRLHRRHSRGPPRLEDGPQRRRDRAWRAEGGRGGDVTLIWGLPLIRGTVAATAELDQEVVDQAAVDDGRFTLVAIDAVHGFGDDMFCEVVLWDRTLRKAMASESLYAEADPEDEPEDA